MYIIMLLVGKDMFALGVKSGVIKSISNSLLTTEYSNEYDTTFLDLQEKMKKFGKTIESLNCKYLFIRSFQSV
jgi:hypothetical protein